MHLPHRSAARWFATLMGGVILLMAVSFVNGYPLFFNDTRSYVRGPALAIQAILHERVARDWPDSIPPPAAGEAGTAAQPADGRTATNAGVTANRSIYYGVLAFLGYATGNFWLTALVQAAWVCALLYYVNLFVVGAGHRVFLLGVALLSVMSSVGFYVGYVMPDVFTPIMIIGASLFALFSRRMTLWQGGFVIGSMAFAVLAHPSHPVILLMFGVLLLIWARASGVRDLDLWRPSAAIVGCVAVGLLGQWAFSAALERFTGQKPLLLPHIEAHLVDMGPGSDYAKNACDPQRFAVCRYKDLFPMNWERFIGNSEAGTGVFAAADPATQRKLSDEQIPFALAVLRYDPVGVVLGVVRDAVEQVFRFSLDDFIVDDKVMANYEARFPPRVAQHIAASAVHEHPDLVRSVSMVFEVVVYASLGCIVALLALSRRSPTGASPQSAPRRFAGMLLLAVVTNGIVCGALASPYDRFQARVVWLVVLGAGVMLIDYARARAPALPRVQASTGGAIGKAL